MHGDAGDGSRRVQIMSSVRYSAAGREGGGTMEQWTWWQFVGEMLMEMKRLCVVVLHGFVTHRGVWAVLVRRCVSGVSSSPTQNGAAAVADL